MSLIGRSHRAAATRDRSIAYAIPCLCNNGSMTDRGSYMGSAKGYTQLWDAAAALRPLSTIV